MKANKINYTEYDTLEDFTDDGIFPISNKENRTIYVIRVDISKNVKYEEDGLYIDDLYIKDRVKYIIDNNIWIGVFIREFNIEIKYNTYVIDCKSSVFNLSESEMKEIFGEIDNINFIEYNEWMIKRMLE